MTERLVQSDLSQSMTEKRQATDSREREKAVAKQIARISGKIVRRAAESRLSHGHYGGRDGYTMKKEGPIVGTKLNTEVQIDDHGMARVENYINNNHISETGVSVSAVPNQGIDATARGRSGGNEVAKHLEGDQEVQAIADVPRQLAELRGHLAEEEIDKQKRDEEYERRYPRAA